MAFCSNCGTQLQDGAKFCASCGTPAGGAVPAASAPPPAAEKVGNVRKCPSCGAEVPAMTAVCPSCGHEFSGVQANSTVQAFFNKLMEMEQQALEKKSGPADPKMTVLKGLAKFYGASTLVPSADEKMRTEFISGFPIPNSKEDILEFVILASSRISSSGSGLMGGMGGLAEKKKENELWKIKCEQAYTKAKMSFGSDKDAIARIESILKEKKIIK
jgi:predicted amidophosphoribosyltransferase